ncbi:phospholipid carrier-dependent glycosyltransferase [Erythrobacter ani]|uniref:Polyprenol-phosphate-mannose--protein mannosyltransferase n=1 Tax=Erythrobacter ani TaxID=2827235 RepID=A0ABS6SNT9_9SPHN|nr:glycosyltransferase family 39 protein [Erythrobacter ani]MBV7266690.1 glycosyltransferase family 39 protein [Erythrobacter ani]
MSEAPAQPIPARLHEPSAPPEHPRDPWFWCITIPLVFGALAAIRLTIPSAPYFDEVHYLPAAREIIAIWGDGSRYINREHPLLGKEILALGIAMFGDNPLGWRIMPLLAGIITIFAGMRAIWHASHERFATAAFGILLVTGFHVFVHARIAMLDIFMAAFIALAAWQFATAIREPERGRKRLALTGIAIGCAMASKWNAVPLAMLPGVAFFAARLSAGRRRLITSRRGIPVPGVSLAEAFLWLGLIPVMVYALTFAPGYWLGDEFHPSPLSEGGLFALHQEILQLQRQVIAPHSYQSSWPQWVMNIRGIWYLYEFTDGAQRGVLLIGNPLTMLLGLPALLWCTITGFWRSDWAKVAVVAGYVMSLGLWLIAPKPVQFYYHYFIPSCFLLAAFALTLSDIHRSEQYRWISYVALAGSGAVFAVFFTILSAGALEGPMSFAKWTWLAGWR